jgi:hypothetical protein
MSAKGFFPFPRVRTKSNPATYRLKASTLPLESISWKLKAGNESSFKLESEGAVNPGKYKTELCRNWQHGHCVFGNKCIFAHGTAELRTRKVGKLRMKHGEERSRYRIMSYEGSGDRSKILPAPRSELSHRLPVFIELTSRSE